MARKSRKETYVNSNAINEICNISVKSELFKTAIYTRLSNENSGKDENRNVIETQISICENFVDKNTELKLVDTYIDDGHTGTNFERPEFNRLLGDIANGKINCIVVRDLSRFGRDYIETGTYLEEIFPNLNVRFISINEQYDSFTIDKTNDALIIPLQNLINSLYSKDISRKVSTALRTQMINGTFRYRNLPYGYMWNEDKTQIIIDKATSDFVKLIFRYKLNGFSSNQIAKKLTELNAPISTIRQYENGVRTSKTDKIDKIEIKWSASTIDTILRNPIYVGDSVFGRQIVALYKNINKAKLTPKEEHIIFKDTHEAIILREDFQKINLIIEDNKIKRQEKLNESEKIRSKIIDLFKGKIHCGDCGKIMYFRRRKYDKGVGENKVNIRIKDYVCANYYRNSIRVCTSHKIMQDELEEKVLRTIKMQIKVATDYEKLLQKLKNSESYFVIKEKQNAKILSLNLKLNSLQKKRTKLYEDFSNGILTDTDYLMIKETFDEDYDKLNRLLDENVMRRNKFNESLSSNNKWITLMKSVSHAKKLNQSLVDEVIERISIYENKNIEIVMKYTDIYKLMVENVDKINDTDKTKNKEKGK